MKKLLITLILIISAAGYTFAAEMSTQAKLQYNQGVDYYKLGQYDKAITCFREAIAIEPDYIDAYYNLGSILEFVKQNDAALTVFKQIIVRKPTDYESVYKAAAISAKLGQTENAKQYLSIIPSSSMVYSKALRLANSLQTDMQTIKQEQKAAAEAAKPITQTNGTYNDLGSPTGITADSRGNLYVAGFSDNAIYRIGPDGTKKLFLKDDRIKGPIGLAADAQDNIYAANYNSDSIIKISNKAVISVFISEIKKPYCLYIKDNMLFVSSQGTNSVLRYKL